MYFQSSQLGSLSSRGAVSARQLCRLLALLLLVTAALLARERPAAAQSQSQDFRPVWSSPRTTGHTSAAWGDVDNDGDLDLALGYFCYGGQLCTSLEVFLNTDGMLEEAPAWSGPKSASTLDVSWVDSDNDGDLELSAVHACSPLLACAYVVLFGNEEGVIGSEPVFSLSDPGLFNDRHAAVWADVDGDADLDLAVRASSRDVSLYLNQGGTIGPTAVWSISEQISDVQLAWGDLEGDGDQDLAVGTDIYVNEGGSLAQTPVGPGGISFTIAWDDIDNDGDDDMAVGANDLIVYINEAGVLTERFRISLDAPLLGLAWVDYDGDGDLDLSTSTYTHELRIYYNYGGFYANQTVSPLGADAATRFAWGDYDGDSDLDLLVASEASGVLYENRSSLLLDPVTAEQLSVGGSVARVALGDVDDDGQLDLAVATQQEVRLYRNTAGPFGSSPDWTHPAQEFSRQAIWGDFNTDGALDLIMPVQCPADESPRCTVLELYANSGTVLGTAPVWSSQPFMGVTDLASGDIDNDGQLDLVVAAAEEPAGAAFRVFLYHNDGAGLSAVPVWSSSEVLNRDIALGDVDGDGDLDLVASSPYCVTQSCFLLRTYHNQGGVLEERAASAITTVPYAVDFELGDYDDDGDPDVALAGGSNKFYLYRNERGDFLPSPVWSGSIAGRARAVAWGDPDQDGDLDLGVAGQCDNSSCALAGLFLNQGGTFEATTRWSASTSGAGAAALAWGDVDADGDLDLLLAEGSKVHVYANLLHNHSRDILPQLLVQQPGLLVGGQVYADPAISAGPTIPVPYRLFQREGRAVRAVLGEYALSGRGPWLPALPANAAPSQPHDTFETKTVRYSAAPAAPLADFLPLDSTITITSPGVIADLDVWVNLTHPQLRDLEIQLIHSSGTSILLANNYWAFGADMIGTVFDDEGPVYFPNASAPYTGRFNLLYASPLFRFDSLPIAGTWTLRILDRSAGQTGTLLSWGLDAVLAEPEVFHATSGVAIPASSVQTSTITVSSTSTLADLNVALNLEHPALGDIIVTLSGPSGTSVDLVRFPTRQAANLLGVTMDDEAATPIPYMGGDGGNAGSYHADAWFGLSRFDQQPISGTWTLRIENNGAPGTLHGWSLLATVDEMAEASGDVDLTISPGQTITSTLTITEAGEIVDLDAGVDISAEHNRCLSIELVAPDSTIQTLLYPGSFGTVLRGIIFDDEALMGVYYYSGMIPPGRYSGSLPLGVFDNTLAQGRWTLAVTNTCETAATLHTWSLDAMIGPPAQASSSVAQPIPDYPEILSSIYVPHEERVVDLEVGLRLSHAAVDDLRITLYPPASNAITLLEAGAQKRPSGEVDIVLDDDAAPSIDDPDLTFGTPFSGRYRPHSALAAVVGRKALGPWNLMLLDTSLGDAGVLHSWSLTLTLESGVQHIYEWDAQGSGVMGQSDDAVFRLRAIPDLTPRPNEAARPYLYGSSVAATPPFRLRGSQVRVLRDGQPAPGALVYRLPAGKELDGTPLADDAGSPFRSDEQGYLQGRGQLRAGDQLLALWPVSPTLDLTSTLDVTATTPLPRPYTLYYTNGRPNTVGVTATTVLTPGVQTLAVSAAHPLYLFDLLVSVEWDLSQDPIYRGQLVADLARASRALYDWSDGQIALGHITVHHNADNWALADVVVHASNKFRPFAAEGGIVRAPITDPERPTLVYETGQVHMGATWNRFARAQDGPGEDWPLVLAHELAHYLLFQDDTYLGRVDGFLASIDSCTGSAMGDVYEPSNSEFIFDPAHWTANCANTLAAQELQRTEWRTLDLWYPSLVPPTATLSGPTLMPFELTTVTVVAPVTPTAVLAEPTFYLDYAGAAPTSLGAQAFLLRAGPTDRWTDDYVVDLGRPLAGQNRVLARGAQPGDQLCVFDRPRQQSGCETIALGDTRLPLQSDGGWTPNLELTPLTTTTLALTVTGLLESQPLHARLFPEYGGGSVPITLTETRPGVYTGRLTAAEGALVGHVQVWREGPRRDVLVAFAVGGHPALVRGGGAFNRGGGAFNRGGGALVRGGGALVRGGGAPLLSPDGQLTFLPHAAELPPDALYTVQGVTGLPPLPPGKVVVAQGYRLASATTVPTGSVSLQYLEQDVLLSRIAEEQLQLHYWDGQRWTALATRRNTTQNLASALAPGAGIYALLGQQTRPTVGALLPAQGTSGVTTTVALAGSNFLDPVRVWLLPVDSTASYTSSLALALGVVATSAQSVTVTVPPTVTLGVYRFDVVNGDGGLARSGAWPLYAAREGCFTERFESGLGQWMLDGRWGIVPLAGSTQHVVTDSPAVPYASADDPEQPLTTTLTSPVISLAGCGTPVLRFRHTYQLARFPGAEGWATEDTARVEVQLVGGAWEELARYSGGGRYGLAALQGALEQRYVASGPDEWSSASWTEVELDLSAYAPLAVRLRLVLEVDDVASDKGWALDDLVVEGELRPILLPMVSP